MDRLVVTRHTTLERLSHYVNIAALGVLLASGFAIYLGLPYLSYSDAYAFHIVAAAAFVANNWIVMPYTAFVNRSLRSYLFLWADAQRLWDIVKNFLTGSEYPPYSVYDTGKGRFSNRLHPVAKLLLHGHYAALLAATVTGIVLYSSSLSLLGIAISAPIVRAFDALAVSFGLSGLVMASVLHLAAAYWFVIEVIVHAGLVQLDPQKAAHLRSIFISGKEDLYSDTTADIVDTSEGSGDFEKKAAIRLK